MSGTTRTVAVTGATGFLGRHTVAAILARGWNVRLLARSEPADESWKGFTPEVVLGSLSDRIALQRLVAGVDAVLHLAGLIKARTDAEFMAVNRDGTRLLAEAVRLRAPKAHFIQISSLAARSPELSGYASSKRAGEDVALETLGRKSVSVIRPPAVYGPGDRETLIFFQLAQFSRIPLPGRPDARFALVHADDAARTIASVAEHSPSGAVHSFSDDRPTGYSWREILETAAAAVGNSKPRFLPVPAAILKGVGNTLGLVSKLGGPAGMVNAGKIRELLHEDWAVRPDEALRLTKRDVRYSLLDGFIDAAVWYRQAGWL